MSIITRQDTNGIKPLLQVGELGYDNYPAGGDKGRVFVGTGTENIGLAKKTEVMVVDGKADAHIARVDNPHNVTKTQVGLGNVDNTSDADKPISIATQGALDLKADLDSPVLTGIPTAPTAAVGTNTTQLATTAYVNTEIANDTYSKVQLDAGQLDNRYYTEAEINAKLEGQIPGNSATATKLATARTINGVAFDGTANITVADSTAVKLTGDQTIADVKTFSSSPIIPTPTTGTQAVNKDYADTKVDKVASTDNAIARYDGTTGKLQNSGVTIDDSGNVGVGTYNPLHKIHMVGDPSYNCVLRIEAGGTTTTDAVLDLTARGSNGAYNNAEIIAVGSTYNGTTLVFNTDNPTGHITRQMNLDSRGNLLLTSGTGALGYGAGAGGTVTQLTSKSTAVTLNKPSGRIQTHSSELIAGANVVFEVNNSLVTITDNVVVAWESSNYRVEGYACTTGKFVIRITNVTSTPRSGSLGLNFTVIRGSVS